MLEVLGVRCAADDKAAGRYVLGELADGSAVTLPLRVVRGRRDGPTLALTGSIHGDEPNGLAAINRLCDDLDPSRMAGTLIGFPLANPFAFISKYRISALDYDRLNLNRVFPGDPSGLITERVASAIFDGAIRHAQYYIDCHDGGYDFIARYLIAPQPEADERMRGENLRLARAFGLGLPVNLLKLPRATVRSYGQLGVSAWQAACEAGVAVICCELGGAGRIWPEFVELAAAGIRNVMIELGMLDEKPDERNAPQIVATDSVWPRPTHGGWWEQRVELGQTVEADEIVGVVRNALGVAVEELRAPFRSVIFDIRNSAAVMTGEWTVHCGRIVGGPKPDSSIPKAETNRSAARAGAGR